jgi:hypothetical protein
MLHLPNLQTFIPEKLSVFTKFDSDKPYFFLKWAKDDKGHMCLYYWFHSKDNKSKYTKRVVLFEFENLFREAQKKGYFTRDDFKEFCPSMANSSPCSFVLMVRILEFLGFAEYQGRGKSIILQNK